MLPLLIELRCQECKIGGVTGVKQILLTIHYRCSGCM